jgi:hypothetical protein
MAAPILGAVLMGACAHAPPIQEMSDARQALQAARESGAGSYARTALDQAEGRLGQAERAIKADDYPEARAEALAAKDGAVSARRLTLSLRAAQASVEGAERAGVAVAQARADLDQARASAAENPGAAPELAERARASAESAVNQHYLEGARELLGSLDGRLPLMSADDLNRYDAARAAFYGNEGRRSYDLARALDASVPLPRDARKRKASSRRE